MLTPNLCHMLNFQKFATLLSRYTKRNVLLSPNMLVLGEGNGNPLQCSCLENPKDGEPGGLPSVGSHRVGHN